MSAKQAKITIQEYRIIQDRIESEVIRLNKIYHDIRLNYYKINCDKCVEEIVYISPIHDDWTTWGFYAYHEIPDMDCYPIYCRWRTHDILCDPRKPLFPSNSTIEEKVKIIRACFKKDHIANDSWFQLWDKYKFIIIGIIILTFIIIF